MFCMTSMKALFSPNLSHLSPNFLKTRPFPLRFSINSKPLQNPNRRYHLKPTRSSFNSSISPNSIKILSLHADAAHPQSGEIHVIIGPMFAGKTTTLLHRIKSESSNGRSIAVIKSDKDTRYGLDSIVTHDGEKFPCWPLADLSSFRQKCGADAYEKLDVIGIDEAQFFDDLYDFCRKAADMDGKTIIVAGLDGDYLRRKFGSILDIVPLADSITKLNARCELCGKRAYFTLRRTEERQTELIGGADMYMPVCRTHYVGGQVIKDAATRIVYEYPKVQSAALYQPVS